MPSSSSSQPKSWRTAKVFISSTFRDMHGERDHLVKVVFPELRERLLQHRIYLDDIDLRWGITEDESKKDRVLDLCLQQIDECRPFFIGILGERYGWVPTTPLSREAAARFEHFGKTQLEAGQSVTELEILFGVLLIDPRMKDRSFFYFRDSRFLNIVPKNQRRNARHRYQEFPTEEEISEIGPKKARREAAKRRLKLRHLKKRIRAVRELGYPVFDDYPARWDSDAYDRPTKSHGRIVGLEEFGNRVRDQLWEAIKAEFDLSDQPPEPTAEDEAARLSAEADDQARFVESRLRVYVGREDLQRDLVAYSLSDSSKLCLVTGPGGSGKSASLAQFVVRSSAALPGVVMLSHFIGASPRSTALRDVLKRLCGELSEKLIQSEKQIRLAEITATGEEAEQQLQAIEQEFTVPEEIAPLAKTWREFLKKIPKEHRVVIVLDAINQLEEGDRSQELWWLPRDLPGHVKVVASCIVDPASPEAESDVVAGAFRHRLYQAVRVEGLRREDRLAILRQLPSLSAKTLDEKQAGRLVENPATENPLYLKVALEELRGFGVYEEVNSRIDALPREGLADAVYLRAGFSSEAMRNAGDPLTALFTQVIERLRSDFEPEVVRSVFALMASARRGLSARELLELIEGSEVRTARSQSDLFPILRQLRPYLVSHAGLLGYFHGNLQQSVRRYYLDRDEDRLTSHRRLAEYFEKQGPWQEPLKELQARARLDPPTPRPANIRRADELPWQWLEAARWDEVAKTLTNLEFVEAKAEAGLVFDLVMDFTRVLERMPIDHGARRHLRLLEQALRFDLHFVARHPTTLFQCMWNLCWWYDSPDAAAHYDSPSGGWPVDGPPWSRPAPDRLSTLLEVWREAKESRSSLPPWLRSLRPPELTLGSPQLACLRGHEDGVYSVACSPDGGRIVSGSEDRTVRIWDSVTGAELACLRGHERAVCSVAYSPDGRRVVTGSGDKTVRVWDATSGAELACLRGHEDRVNDVAYSPNGRRIVTGSQDETVRVWDATGGAELACLYEGEGPVRCVAYSPDGRHISVSVKETVRVMDAARGMERNWACLRGHESSVNCVAYSPDGHRIVSGSDDQTVRVWDAARGAELACLRGHESFVNSVAYSPDGRRIVSGSIDRTVRVWDATSGMELACLRGHADCVHSVAYSRDGQRIVSGASDHAVRVWDAAGGVGLACLRGHESWVWSVAYSPDGRRVVTGSVDKTVRVWDAASGVELACLRGHDDQVNDVAYSPDGRRVVSGSDDKTVRIWDAVTGAELARLRRHEGRVCSVAYSPDGRRIVTGSDDKTVRVWDATSGAELACLRGHEDRVNDVEYSPDGRRVVSGSDDETVRVWDEQSAVELACLEHAHGVLRVRYSPDGRYIVSGSLDRAVRVWDAASGECLDAFQGSANITHVVEASVFPWRAVSLDLETVIEPAGGGAAVAWFPAAIVNRVTNPSGRSWAGSNSNHLYLIRLEGEPDLTFP
jgi:WD40 repeat protein